jgi:hypothetical protein
VRYFLAFMLILTVALVAYTPSGAANLSRVGSPLEGNTAPGQSTAPATPTPGTPADYPTQGYGPINFPENINPLTGLPVADSALLNRRPLAIKISNGPRSVRPQWGLSLADHVFEYFHEVGRTRFNAIYYGNDAEIVGPIRSARYADEDLVRMYKAIFAFGSADIRILNKLWVSEFSDRLIFLSDYPCPATADYPLCRTDPNVYNHLVADTALLSEHFTPAGIANGRQYLDGLHFNVNIPEGSAPGESVTTRYSQSFYNRWEYDPEIGRYLRYEDKYDDPAGNAEEFELLTDRLTEQPIMADNIVILLTEHTYYSREPEVWEIELFGYGKAYLFRDGQVYEISWARAVESDLIAVTYPDGSRFPLQPGNTWYQVVGASSTITDDGSGNWRFHHWTP